jgi:Fe-S-cluster containining protein
MGSIPCEHCTALCCRYVAVPVEKPKTKRDFDDIRWYVMHEGVTVFVEEGEWYAQFTTRCSNLLPDGRCGIYEQRPAICREYKAGECDYTGGDYDYDALFTEASQIEEYAAEYFRKKRAARKPRRPKRRAKLRRAS